MALKLTYASKYALAFVLLLPVLYFMVIRLPNTPQTRPSEILASNHGTGIATSLSRFKSTNSDVEFTAIHNLDATWVRTDLSWNAVQSSGPNTYDWSRYDRFAEAANAHGIKVLFVIGLTPEWARSSGCSSELCPPSDSAQFAKFAGEAAKHFRPLGVNSWEIWNEPNISYRYRPSANPTSYVLMLKGAFTAIKTNNPNADVIAASTAPSGSDAKNFTPSDFLKAIYRQGAKGYFTAVSAHPYTYPNTPAHSNPYDAWGQLPNMHDIMESNGDGDKKIWITEFGSPTNGPNKPGEYVNEDLQAQILSEAVAGFAQYDWSGPFFYYDYKDSGTDTSTSENFYGLMRFDGSHKPAYDVFKSAAKKL